ncbi:CHAP domain-containing protein [Ruminococcus sp. HUN007]|uniref:CHAP domain-containing protein n=1 Tax=Ruminococcus sp. HUN007 TaxID=1514668 RepID=UPI0005D2283D|nr:CHAP domain-containing protein [Ruminococcus sp. HUN007]
MDTHFRSVLSSFLSAAIIFTSAAPAVSAYENQFDIRTEAPENNEEAPEYRYYYSTENPYNTFHCEMPNCTAYAWGRIFEILGEAPLLSRNNAGRWYGENRNSHAYSYGCEARDGSVKCFDRYDNYTGHVSVTESVSEDGNTVLISESQYGGALFTSYEEMSDATWENRGYRLLGYIYPDDTEGRFYGDAFRIKTGFSEDYLTRTDESDPALNARNASDVRQNFRFEPLENGSYRICSVYSELVLTRTENGVFFLENDLSENTEWSVLTEINDLYTICDPADTNQVLAFTEGRAYVSEYEALDDQFWDLKRVTGDTDLNTTERNIVFSLDCTASRTEYYTDEFLDLSGIKFFLNNREIANVDTAKLTAFYDFSVPGTQTVTVVYGYSSISFDVTVTEPGENEEVIRNSEFRSNIADFILLSSDVEFSSDFDVNLDGTVNSLDLITFT